MLRAMQDLEVTEIIDLGELERLRPEWTALWARCPDATPFQSPAWIVSWWRHFGQGGLLALALRRKGQLVGLAPLFLWENEGVRTLLPIGVGVTDYLDGLFDRELGGDGARMIFRYLAGRPHLWDICDLQQLRPGSRLLDAAAPAGWSDERTVQDACPVLELPARIEDLPDHLSRSTVRHLRANRRRAEKVGAVGAEQADESSLEECLRALFRLHGARWNSLGHPGVLSDAAIQAFHTDVAAGMLRQGLLRLNALRLEERIVAVYYGFLGKRRAYAYLSGFDPAWTRLGLGSRMIGWSIEQAIREGAEEFHFLRGREAYKYKWGGRDRFNSRRRLRRTAIRSGAP